MLAVQKCLSIYFQKGLSYLRPCILNYIPRSTFYNLNISVSHLLCEKHFALWERNVNNNKYILNLYSKFFFHVLHCFIESAVK